MQRSLLQLIQRSGFGKRATQLVGILLMGGLSAASLAQQAERPAVIELQSTIVGNKEQPEVIYIVPWQALDAPAPQYRPVQSLVEEQIQLLDRDEWRRRTHFNLILKQSTDPSKK